MGRIPAKRVILAGLGEKITGDTIRFVSGKMARKSRELGLPDFSVMVPDGSVCGEESSASQIVEGSKLSCIRLTVTKRTRSKDP